MADVEKRHREAAASAVKPDWRRDDALEEPTIGILRRVAQALADAEQRGYDRAIERAQQASCAAMFARAGLGLRDASAALLAVRIMLENIEHG